AEGRRRADRFTIDAAAAADAGIASRRLDAGAKRRQPQRALDLGGDRPGAVALIIGDVLQRGTAQAPPRRQERGSLQTIGLAGAIRPDKGHHVAPRIQGSPAIVAEVRQRQAMNAGRGHVEIISSSCPALCRASTSFWLQDFPAPSLPGSKTWMAGTSPAMT